MMSAKEKVPPSSRRSFLKLLMATTGAPTVIGRMASPLPARRWKPVQWLGKYRGSGGYNYMNELHNSAYQRLMIAEANLAYSPALILLDGVEAFIDRGPDVGTKVAGNLILAGTDRIAIDVIGLAALRLLGLTGKAAQGSIFGQEQIAREASPHSTRRPKGYRRRYQPQGAPSITWVSRAQAACSNT